jgi:hypothetical protein
MAWQIQGCTVDQFLYEYSKQYSRVDQLYRTVIFSDSVDNGRGEKLADALEEYGTVVRSKKANNPIHNHKIQVFIWHPTEAFIKNGLPKIVEKWEQKMSPRKARVVDNWDRY